jgi:hypothetical protein
MPEMCAHTPPGGVKPRIMGSKLGDPNTNSDGINPAAKIRPSL